jgi:hypothetical protein
VDPTGAANTRTVGSAVVDGRTLEFRIGDIDNVQYSDPRFFLSTVADGPSKET